MEKRLRSILEKMGSVTVAFSGGLDSSLLAKYANLALGDRAQAVTVKTEFVPEEDIVKAIRKSKQIGIKHTVVNLCVLDDDIATNCSDRCYLCKKKIFTSINRKNIVDGTLADDDSARPGLRALSELNIPSPLKEAGFTKKAVKELSKKCLLPVEPSNSCLATRIPLGTRITLQSLKKIEQMEKFLHDNGVVDVRARLKENSFFVEIQPFDFNTCEAIYNEIKKKAKEFGLGVELGKRRQTS